MGKKQVSIIVAVIVLPILVGIAILGKQDKVDVIGGQKIGLVKIIDVIYSSERYVRQLQQMREDDAIAGVLLRIESPGGAVSPSQEIFSEVAKFRESGKPVVVSMGSVAASGGYYIAAPAYRIFANPGTITGSIGVIMNLSRYYKLTDKIGIEFEAIKSGGSKDIGNPFRALTDSERRYLQSLTMDMYEQFLSDVAFSRHMDLDSLRLLADGRVFTGRQAVKTGLIDTIGTCEDALDYLKQHLGLSSSTKTVEKKDPSSLWKDLIADGIINKLPFSKRPFLPAGCYFVLESFVGAEY